VNESEPRSLPLPLPPSVALPEVVSTPDPPPRLPRWLALLQVVAVCGIPTQIAIAVVLMLTFGMSMTIDASPSLSFFTIVSAIDTVVVVLLIRAFLAFNGERATDVFIGTRPVAGEVVKGLLLVPVVFLLVAGLVLALRAVAPWMQTVERNPLEAFITTPLDAGIFLAVAVLAGGVREELQRAFILHRFEHRLGGAPVGLVLFSVTFGLLHLSQGMDVAVAIGLLGLAWGIIFIRRRSAMLPMANHAGFNAIQVIQVAVVRSMGW
jgi:membrane protease YdiL (CAAX protease family)